ncbi:MAG TPA: hypothetical protein VJ801_17580 [Polyangia bacterium]|jgi:hypothetical protein|nr:hypothetical protein [Polyangia bacterium]
MIATILDSAARNAPNWAALIGIVWLLKLVLDRQYKSFRDDHRDTRVFTTAAIEALRDMRNACERCHSDIVVTVKRTMGDAADKILNSIQKEHAVTRAASGDIVAALGREEDRTIKAIKEALADYQHSRSNTPPPPVLGVGSQVKDSVATP